MPRFEQLAQVGEPVEIVSEMSRLTLNNAFQTLMEHDISGDMDAWMQHVCMMIDYANSFFAFPAYKRFLGRYFPRTWHGRYHKSRNELGKLLDLVVKARLEKRGNGEEGRTDLLSQLLFHPDRSPKRNFSPRYVRDETMSFLFAAHETTAVTLSWAWFFLSQNPKVETRLHEELDRVLDGRPPTLSDLEKMPYGRMIIDETLRLCPPVWHIARQTTQPEVVGGYEVPRNAIVLMIVWLTHRHPDFWEEPERFDPERFTPEASAGRHPFAYVPFGGGPRQCIGRRTALIETQLALSAIAQRFTLRPAPGYVAKPLSNITLRPSENMPMIFYRRLSH